MRIIALMVLRNESWILGASLRAVTKWCDGAAIFLDRCTDATSDIVRQVSQEHPEFEMMTNSNEDGEHWDEMDHRQINLEDARRMGGTHFAIVDADEILTHNNLGKVRGWFEGLEDGQVLDVPMIAPWKSLEYFSPATRGIITLGWKDQPGMGFAPRGEEKYHHHNRPPHGLTGRVPVDCEGGVFHLQWAHWDRLIHKHRHYMLTERLRWNYSAEEINEKYHWFDKPPHGMDLLPVRPSWWGMWQKKSINLKAPVWYEHECKRLVKQHGAERFQDLDLFGWKP